MYIQRITSLVCSLYETLPYTALWYGLRTNLGGCKIPKFSGKGCPHTPRQAFELCAEVCTNVVCSCCALSSTMSWLHHCLKLSARGLALFGVIFRPLQEVEAIMGDGQIFATGPFFTRLQYLVYCEQMPACANSYHQLVTLSHVDAVHCIAIHRSIYIRFISQNTCVDNINIVVMCTMCTRRHLHIITICSSPG